MTFKLPDLPYGYDALEPKIDQETMHLHHDKHHNTYVTNANKALENYEELSNKSAEDLLRHFDQVPEDIQTAVRNNVGGHVNHTLYWEILSPNGGGEPTGDIKVAIENAFGSYDDFKDQFKEKATGRFGSGWAFLVVDNGQLKIVDTPNQDSPLMENQTPILGIDVWEHAYYLNYKNVRADYIDAFFDLINWDKVNELYSEAQ